MTPEDFFIAGLNHNADFLNACGKSFLNNDLHHRLGNAITVDNGEQFLLNSLGCWKESDAVTGRGNDSFSYLHALLYLMCPNSRAPGELPLNISGDSPVALL